MTTYSENQIDISLKKFIGSFSQLDLAGVETHELKEIEHWETPMVFIYIVGLSTLNSLDEICAISVKAGIESGLLIKPKKNIDGHDKELSSSEAFDHYCLNFPDMSFVRCDIEEILDVIGNFEPNLSKQAYNVLENKLSLDNLESCFTATFKQSHFLIDREKIVFIEEHYP